MRLKQSLLLLLVVFAPGMANALGLGKIQLESALNEPFEARIELLSATVEELDSLKIILADEAAFSRAGILRSAALRELRFIVKESEAGPDYVRVYSNEPIREPFLNFLIEVSWSKGRLYREYTVLLDPPIYADNKTQRRLAQPIAPESSTTGTIAREIEDNKVIYNPDYQSARPSPKPAAARVSPQISYSGGDYGPVISGDTLWSIAKAMRPDNSVSVQQMMLALLRANPEAFINNNINGLKRGHVLQMPDMSDVRSVSRDDAFSEAKLQNSMWDEARGAMATAVTPRPEAAAALPEEPVTPTEEIVTTPEPIVEPAPVEPEGEPELRLVAPTDKGELAGQGGEPSTEALTQELALVSESLEALKLENVELKDKLSETEVIIDDLKRLIVLKESELAALQQQIADEQARAAAEQMQSEEVEVPMEEPSVAEATVEEEPVEAMAEPETTETETEITEEMAEEPAAEAVEEMPAEEEMVETESSTFLPSGLMGLVDQFKNNLPYSAAVPGGAILLILIISMLIQRRRSESAIEIPQSAFPEFDDMEETASPGSEDETDINLESADADSEAETILPGSDDEPAAPDFEEDKTQIVSQQPAEPEPDAFDLAPAEEEDPLAEVNVFLAYEHFDQAEDFVKKAIQKDPDNLEFRNKLLEVYYAANNKKGYEEAARDLHEMVMGKGDYWNMAVAMWQEISPNRELFAEPTEDEEDAGTAASGGGIVNIAGDEGGSADLDFDLDTTAGSDELLNVTGTEEEADVLDVTAAVDMGDDEVLDVTAATEGTEDNAEDAGISTSAEEDNSLDFSFDMEDSAKEETASEDVAPEEAASDDVLDLSFDPESKPAAEEDNALDISLDVPESASETAETDAKEAGDGSLDFAIDMEEPAKEEPVEDATEKSNAGADLLDVTSAIDFDSDSDKSESESNDDLLNVSITKTGEDLLDVTSSSKYELDNSEDLLDVTTSATSAGIDADELLGGDASDSEENKGESLELPGEDKETATATIESDGLDFELSPDDSNEGDQESSFDGIDITAGDGGADQSLDFNIEAESEDKLPDLDMDMDSTMQIPAKRSTLVPEKETPVKKPVADDNFDLVIDEDEDDADHTIMVPRSSGSTEQSEEDEIATQLDLAKAYVELGDKDNARTILDEIIAVGNAEQKQQAQELLNQI